MKRAIGYTALGVLSYIVFVVVLFPAERAYSFVKDSLQGVTLYDVKGSVWSGKAQAVTFNGEAFRGVDWSIKPWSVALGRVDIGFTFDNADRWGNGTLGLRLDKMLQLNDAEVQMAASEIKRYAPRLAVELDGALVLEVDKLLYDPESKQLAEVFAKATWKNAGLKGMTQEPLGNFLIDFNTGAEGITGKLSDDGQGPLSAEGELLLKPDNSYQFNATFAARDKNRTDIVQGLGFLGRPDRDGKVKVSQSGRL